MPLPSKCIKVSATCYFNHSSLTTWIAAENNNFIYFPCLSKKGVNSTPALPLNPFSIKGPFSSVQLLSYVQLFVTPWTAARQDFLSITNSQSLSKLMSVELVMPSSYFILCRPFSSCLQPFPASGSFQMSVLRIQWPKYCSFSFSISPSSEHPGLISFRLDWLNLLVVQGPLKSLRQHHSSKDFRAPQNKVSHSFPIYLPGRDWML